MRHATTGMEFAIQDAMPFRLLELDLAIDALALENPRLAQAIELHYFQRGNQRPEYTACGGETGTLVHHLYGNRFAG